MIRRPVVGIPQNAVQRKRHSQAAGRSSQNHASWTCYVYRHLFAAGRPSRVGPYAQGRWPCFLRIAELWQPTFISSPVCDIVGDAQRAYRYGNSAKCCSEKTPFAGRRPPVAVRKTMPHRFVVYITMKKAVARCSWFVKPCSMDLLCISPFIRGGPL